MRYKIAVFLAMCAGFGFALGHYTDAFALSGCKPGNGTVHCYETGNMQFEHPRALIFSAQLQASMTHGFATAEGWANFPAIGGQFGDWIETGLMVWPFGEKGNLQPHLFWATEHGGQFYALIQPYPAKTQTAPRYYFAISDEGSNGCYVVHDMLSPETGGYAWKKEDARYCGRPGVIEVSTVGGEIETEAGTLVKAQTETALSNEENGQRIVAPWWNWPEWATGYSFMSPEIIAWRNSEGGPGSVGWRTAQLPAAAASSQSAMNISETVGKMTVQTGTKLAARLKLTPPNNGHKPTGTYRATVKNSTGQITAEYVGDSYPDEAKVLSGGTG